MKMHLYERLQFLEIEMRMVAFSLDLASASSFQNSILEISERLKERFETLALLRCRARTMPLIGRVPEPSPVTEEEA
jgi:hypothetical protein